MKASKNVQNKVLVGPDPKSDNSTVETTSKQAEILAISRNPDDLERMTSAVQKLRNDIITRFEDPSCVTLMMHVNLNTAKADLIPFPNKANMGKLKDHFNELPKRVQNVISKSIPEEDMKAVHAIWDLLDSEEVRNEGSDMSGLGHPKSPEQISKRKAELPYHRIISVVKEGRKTRK